MWGAPRSFPRAILHIDGDAFFASCEVAKDRVLDAEVERHDSTWTVADGVALRSGHRGHEVNPIGPLLGACRSEQRRLTRSAERRRKRSRVTDEPGEATGIDTRDARDAVPTQQRIKTGPGAVVAVATSEITHDDAPAEGADRLEVGVGHSVIADVGVRERDDLAGIAGVGERLLVAGQAGREDDLTGRPLGIQRAEGMSGKDLPVLQHQSRRHPPDQ
mgnify:CR=1 FL=1